MPVFNKNVNDAIQGYLHVNLSYRLESSRLIKIEFNSEFIFGKFVKPEQLLYAYILHL